MSTWDLLVGRGWLFGWMAFIPAIAMAMVWVVALFSDARHDPPPPAAE
jgi:hypothetical protein